MFDAVAAVGAYLLAGYLGIFARDDAIDEAMKVDPWLSRHNLPCWPWLLCVLAGPLTAAYYEVAFPRIRRKTREPDYSGAGEPALAEGGGE